MLTAIPFALILAAAPLDPMVPVLDEESVEEEGVLPPDAAPGQKWEGVVYQVRIEQRVIIRVPRRAGVRQEMSAMPQSTAPARTQRFQLKKMGRCLPMNEVAGVQVLDDNSLVLHMNDRRMVRAELEKACPARQFYQGFYMERSGDGKLCSGRDVLQARSGGKCSVDDLREMVADRD